jgi:hypothetical protein
MQVVEVVEVINHLTVQEDKVEEDQEEIQDLQQLLIQAAVEVAASIHQTLQAVVAVQVLL